MNKILISYATAGAGHKKAALAIKEAFDELAPKDTEITIIDSLDYTNAFFRWAYLKGFIFMVNRLPVLWGLAYYITDNFFVNAVMSNVRTLNNRMSSGKLRKYLSETKPDIFISTHFFASEVASDMKRRGKLTSCLVTVVTDYMLHLWWVADCTDLYIVGSGRSREELIRRKTDPDKIKVLGIPVGPVFSKPIDRRGVLEKLGFRDGVLTILVIGGGLGFGPIVDMVKIADGISKPVQIIAVCGRNENLVKKLEELAPGLKNRLKVFGFVDNVHEYMGVSDILVSKCGGITAAESLAKDLPMVIVSPIMGQETRNSDFLTSHDAAIRIDRISDLKGALEGLASHPERLDKMKQSIRNIKKPSACFDIARMAAKVCTACNMTAF